MVRWHLRVIVIDYVTDSWCLSAGLVNVFLSIRLMLLLLSCSCFLLVENGEGVSARHFTLCVSKFHLSCGEKHVCMVFTVTQKWSWSSPEWIECPEIKRDRWRWGNLMEKWVWGNIYMHNSSSESWGRVNCILFHTTLPELYFPFKS